MVKRGKKKALNVYANLSARRANAKDQKSRARAEYLATLPKHPVKRMLYRLHPKRFWAYWWSKRGAIMALKVVGVSLGVMVLFTGALFAYYRKDLDSIKPEELAKRVQTTVNKYYDRNGVLLWEDKGSGDYKLVVDSNEIAGTMKQATVAIEDKDFYKHIGISFSGIFRAVFNNFTGGDTQGGSTLTQQLVKQVFFTDQAQDRGLAGIPRKIKEAILSVEVERMYNKDQILTLYLNESPYGGRRNGVESASETYFGKSAKDLTLAESALLASIPQYPGYYDPYNTAGNADLIKKQHVVLDDMVAQKMITQSQADSAKMETVLGDHLLPESSQYSDIKAPHFVQLVRSELESSLGKATVGKGGLTITTTLDYRMQQVVESNVTSLFNTKTSNGKTVPENANFDNSAVTIIDNKTGQILAMDGSRDYNYPDYGQDNAALAFIQPGSTIKPLVYASLFQQKPAGQANYGMGSVLSDDPLPQSIYATADGTTVQDFDLKFRGALPIAMMLPESRNIPAIKAMYINGQANTIQTIHALGDKSYCTDGVDATVGLASAIGGCGLKQIEHVNAFATLADNGVYNPHAEILKVTNSEGDTLQQWKSQAKQVLDPQISYMLTDDLSQDKYRAPSFGYGAKGFNVPGVKTFTKSGTSNLGTLSKDLWMMSASPAVTTSIWVGNHDTKAMSNALSSIVGPTIGNIQESVHKDILAPEGAWKSGDWYTQPSGVQNIGGYLFPSWYNSKDSSKTTAIVFDTISKKRASDCTPDSAKVTLNVSTFTDPITKQQSYTSPSGYDVNSTDDDSDCSAANAAQNTAATVSLQSTRSGQTYTFTATVTPGSAAVSSVSLSVGNSNITMSSQGGNTYTATYKVPGNSGTSLAVATVTDANGDTAKSNSVAVNNQ